MIRPRTAPLLLCGILLAPGLRPGSDSLEAAETSGAKVADAKQTASAPKTGAPAARPGPAAPVPEGFQAPAGGWPASAKTGFQKGVKLEGASEARAFFHLSVPAEYTPEKAWPLMLILHGSGGHADDLAGVFKGVPARRGVITVFPQALEDKMLAWNYPEHGMYFLRIIRQVAKTYRIDPQRVYLIGHSMGGGGSYSQGAVLHDVWAAIAPLSGWYWMGSSPRPKPEFENWLKDVPTYIIHGDQDHNVPVQLGRMANEDLKKMGNKDFVYKELPGVGHDVFTNNATELRAMIDWVLGHTRPTPANLAAAQACEAEWGKAFGWSPEGGLLGSYRK